MREKKKPKAAEPKRTASRPAAPTPRPASTGYVVKILPSAEKTLDAIPHPTQKKLRDRLKDLAVNPRPNGVEPLTDRPGQYRIRQGDYRAIYTVKDDQVLVLVLTVDNRKDVYRKR